MEITNKYYSQYSGAITGGGYLLDEFDRILPLLQSPNAADSLKEELTTNRLLLMNSQGTRKKALNEFKRRFAACPAEFWDYYQTTTGKAHQLAYFYVLLQCYKIIAELHLRVTVRKFQASCNTLSSEDIRQEFNEIAAHDNAVGSWSETTGKKIISTYRTILRKVGLLEDKTNLLHPLSKNVNDYHFFLEKGEYWFLEACLLYKYEIELMKGQLL